LRAYLQLFRLPNVFTAMADILLGYLLTHRSLDPWYVFILLLAASACLYTAGMVLNDYFDRAQDARERPFRPLPSGRVSERTAQRLGYGLLVAGVLLGWLAGAAGGSIWPGLVATLLAGAVYLYDGVVKPTPAAPIVMGLCRTLNVLLGMSASSNSWTGAHGAAAIGVGVYIVGVTTFARSEARESGRGQLAAGLAILLAGLGIVASLPSWATGGEWPAINPPGNWYIFWAVLAALIGQRCMRAVLEPAPERVQPAVKNAIFSLVIIDAGMVLATQDYVWAFAILALLAPMLLLGRWIYST
jgi:4-hydroxybenzoate polyprenyltransferase